MTDVERLLAIEAIRQLKARYFRCMDQKDFAGLAETFAPDAMFGARYAKEAPDDGDGASLRVVRYHTRRAACGEDSSAALAQVLSVCGSLAQ